MYLKRVLRRQISREKKEILKQAHVGIIDKKNSINLLNISTALDAAKNLMEAINDNSKYVVIKGAITDKLLEDLMELTEKYKEVIFLVEDATKLFLSKKLKKKFQKKGGVIKVLNPINVIAVTINPTSPLGYKFEKGTFLNLMKKNLNVPVYDLGADT